MKKVKLSITSDGSGDGTTTDTTNISGWLYAVQWLIGTCDAGVDATLSTVNSDAAATLLTLTDANASALYYPRAVVQSEAGANLTGTSGGDRALLLLSGNLKVVLAQAGDTKTGSVIVYYEDL